MHISTVGVSALIAPDGRLLERSGHFTQQVLEERLPLRTALTPATRLGVWPEVALTALGLLLVGAGLLRSRRSRGTRPAVEAPEAAFA